MTDSGRGGRRRLSNTLLLAGIILGCAGVQVAALADWKAGVILLIVGTVVFVCGCCQHCHERGRSWALGLWSIPVMLLINPSPDGRPTDQAELVGYVTGTVLCKFALAFGLMWLLTRRRRGANGGAQRSDK